MNGPLPLDWPVPAWHAKPPVPCTKAMLVRWLAKHHGVAFDEHTVRMPTLVRFAENRYYPEKCPHTVGDYPATWDVWAFVVENEKRIRGGQQSLF